MGIFDDMNDTTEVPSPEPTTPEAGENAVKGADAFTVIEKLNSENAELKDRILRALADVENMRRRSEREASDARIYAVTALARDLLPVADNLSRALDSAPAEALRRRCQIVCGWSGAYGARTSNSARQARRKKIGAQGR